MALVSVLAVLPAYSPTYAGGIPVFDIANMKQNTIAAIEGVNQTMKMIEQYQLQLLQYENMLRNTVAPAAYVWNQAQMTTMRLMGMMNTLNYYRYQAGSLDGYLYSTRTPPTTWAPHASATSGCTESERATLENNRRLNADGEKTGERRHDPRLDQQQHDLQADARAGSVAETAQDAPGQMLRYRPPTSWQPIRPASSCRYARY